ncbi:MAG: hypothetical protein KIS66_05380 [Fimbriimonadaceae bacterium]|nr:hypothetical protein [Fimbriimonadaceae bacterium]
MPELPDVTIYVEALAARTVGEPLRDVRVFGPSVLRSFEPPLSDAFGKRVVGVRRVGKRIAIVLEDELFVVIHLMVSGRLLWQAGEPKGPRPGGKTTMALLRFLGAHLILTEASTKKRAGLTVVRGEAGLAALDPGGLEPLTATPTAFAEALTAENRTLKRALTNPRAFSGIGNAYSDEILHAARLSPLRLTRSLTEDEVERLRRATVVTLTDWTERLRQEFGGRFPGRGTITAFRPDFAAHGKYGQPCPTCGKPIQRIVYAENETNYCAVCQNEGRLLSDRALSRLLKSDWPKTLEAMLGDGS